MNYNPNSGLRNPQAAGGRKVQRVSDINAMGPSAAPMMGVPPPPSYMPAVTSTATTISGVPQMNSNDTYAGNLDGFNNGSTLQMPPSGYNYMMQSPAAAPTQQQQQQQQYMQTEQAQQYGAPMGVAIASNQSLQFGNPNLGNMGVGVGGAGIGSAQQFAPQSMSQFAMLQQPIVQDMALQYGQRLADQGKQLMGNQFEKYIPVGKLRYYFAVDNNYVIHKLRLLLFPFTHKDWSLKYDQENPVQPRYDINAPDLYIPTMAYITYVVVAGLMLGMQQRFSPEQLGMQASSALAYNIFELIVYSITLYVVNIKTNIKTLDLLAFSGYKFVIIVACLLASTVFHATGYYVMLIYLSLTLGFFLLRTLKTKVLHDNTSSVTTGAINYDPYGHPQQLDYTGGRKRKLYFLFLIVGGQALLSFLLSKHLYLTDKVVTDAGKLKF